MRPSALISLLLLLLPTLAVPIRYHGLPRGMALTLGDKFDNTRTVAGRGLESPTRPSSLHPQRRQILLISRSSTGELPTLIARQQYRDLVSRNLFGWFRGKTTRTGRKNVPERSKENPIVSEPLENPYPVILEDWTRKWRSFPKWREDRLKESLPPAVQRLDLDSRMPPLEIPKSLPTNIEGVPKVETPPPAAQKLNWEEMFEELNIPPPVQYKHRLFGKPVWPKKSKSPKTRV